MKNPHIALIVFLFASLGCNTNKKQKVPDNQVISNEQSEPTASKYIMFFGNSLTAGYGLDIDHAFPAIIQNKLDSLDYDYQVINAGLSGETTASGTNRIDWVLRTVPDIFVLELGANDGLRGLPLSETKKNLQFIIEVVVKKNPDVKILLAGIKVPPNLGQEYTSEFDSIFPAIANENKLTLIPFLLDGVAGNPDLNLEDGIHPTAEGQRIVAETVWRYLFPLLEKNPV